MTKFLDEPLYRWALFILFLMIVAGLWSALIDEIA